MDPQQSAVLAAIDHVAGLCEQLLQQQDDSAVAYALQELKLIKAAVTQAWPLSAELKRRISLGPFAARNIDDWNKPLAQALMTLHHVLRNDGEGVERLGPI